MGKDDKPEKLLGLLQDAQKERAAVEPSGNFSEKVMRSIRLDAEEERQSGLDNLLRPIWTAAGSAAVLALLLLALEAVNQPSELNRALAEHQDLFTFTQFLL